MFAQSIEKLPADGMSEHNFSRGTGSRFLEVAGENQPGRSMTFLFPVNSPPAKGTVSRGRGD